MNDSDYFIVIDNEEGELSDLQFAWLEDKLKKGVEYEHIFMYGGGWSLSMLADIATTDVGRSRVLRA